MHTHYTVQYADHKYNMLIAPSNNPARKMPDEDPYLDINTTYLNMTGTGRPSKAAIDRHYTRLYFKHEW